MNVSWYMITQVNKEEKRTTITFAMAEIARRHPLTASSLLAGQCIKEELTLNLGVYNEKNINNKH